MRLKEAEEFRLYNEIADLELTLIKCKNPLKMGTLYTEMKLKTRQYLYDGRQEFLLPPENVLPEKNEEVQQETTFYKRYGFVRS